MPGRRFGLAAFAAALLLQAGPARAAGPLVQTIHLDGEINSATAGYVQRTAQQAAVDHASALVVLTNTPGGYSSAMDQIITTLLASPMAVIVYVSPAGARAASAGLFVAEAADLVAMAPGTNIGSAHPIAGNGSNLGGDLGTKVLNDAVARIRNLAALHGRNADWCEKAVRESVNVGADEAVNLHVADLVARDLPSLLGAVDGRALGRPQASDLVMATAGATVRDVGPNPVEDALHALIDPNIAYLLMLIAIYGLIAEVTNPGAILPGVVGGLAGILALVALTSLPVNLAGVLLVGLAFLLFLADIKAPTHGVLTVGGVLALVLGSAILFQAGPFGFGVDVRLIAGVGLSSLIGFALVVRQAIRARSRRAPGGPAGLESSTGEVREDLAPEGSVFVAGASYPARSLGGPITSGTLVRVVQVAGGVLTVEPLGDTAVRGPGPGGEVPST